MQFVSRLLVAIAILWVSQAIAQETHDHPVPDVVWTLYARAWQRCGPVATLLEWDADIPPFETLLAELAKAQPVREAALEMA